MSVWSRKGVMLGVGVSSLLFEQTELMSVFLKIPNSTKHFPSEYYCNKHCPLGASILHAEFLSMVQWDFWQELQGAYGISVLDRDVLLMEKPLCPYLAKTCWYAWELRWGI